MVVQNKPIPLVESRRVEFTFDFDKFLAALHYMVAKGVPGLDKYKICKLLFLADKYHLVRHGRPIIGDRYCALQHGPVPSQSLDLLNEWIKLGEPSKASKKMRKITSKLELDRKYQYPRIKCKEKITLAETAALSKSDLDALDHVIKSFGKKGFDELTNLTHSVYAYQKANDELSDLRYEDFFKEDTDAIEGALEEMLENDEIRRAFPSE